MAEGANDFSSLGVDELAEAYVERIRAAADTEHVGRTNRLLGDQFKILKELRARGKAGSVLRQLAYHSDIDVRAAAANHLDWLDRPVSEASSAAVRDGPLRAEIRWQCENPPAAALTQDEIAARLRASVPEACDRLMDLALPAIGLWPQRRVEIAPTASRFGGGPLAPRDWQWPTVEDEPLLFIGQINCAELRGLPGAELLPSSGLLAFFGDHDTVQGCSPLDERGAYYFPDLDRLVAVRAPIEPLKSFLPCALALRSLLDLPHPFSRAVRELQLNAEEDSAYRDAWYDIRYDGIPPTCVSYSGFSKLLGWPVPVQNDLAQFQYGDGDARLLLQVDEYCNGDDLQSFGPGGSLYYVLCEADLRAHQFERCELEGQFT